MTVRVRPAAPADHEAAIAVWAASDTARRGAPSPPEVPQMLRERFALGDVWVLVADDDGVVVGVAQGAPAREDGGTGPVLPGRCHLSMVFVAPDRWGEGIGSVLVDAAVALAAGLGYDTVQLYTHEDNDRAQRLYAGKGFLRDGDVRADAWGDPVGRWARRLADPPL
ncbi:MAG TPA: GNAT family N-acetyltransferase [Actinomycetes bacterium]|nr:GNAT family N-acetyltransferase [Actinomycetes bacterium]